MFQLQIVGVQQYLVRPVHPFGKERKPETSSPTSPDSQQISPELPIPDSLLQVAGRPLNEVIENVSRCFCYHS